VPPPWVDALLQTMDEALFLLDSAGTILRANAAARRLTARDEGDLHGRGFGEVVRGVDAAVSETMSEGTARRADLAVTTPDGHRVPIEAAFTRLAGADAATDPRVLCVAHDASLTKQLQNELRVARGAALSAARQRTMFLATMSHEIRTPLNGVIGMAGLLLDTPLAPEQRQMLETINNSGHALLDLVNDILDFTRVDAGQIELELVGFDLNTMIDDLMDGHAPAAHAKGLELVTDLDARLPAMVVGDPGRLRQVLSNLLGNAIKFTERGHVLLSVRLLRLDDIDASMHFEVRDSGIGISDQVREALFRPFVQADPSTARRHGGSGLGLAVARRLVRLMGGELDVESAPREGARFSFRLDMRYHAHPGSTPTTVPALALRGARVLLASDCLPRRDVMLRMLEGWGARASWSSCADAWGSLQIADARHEPFAAVIVDASIVDGEPLGLPRRIVAGEMIVTPSIVVAIPVGAVPAPFELADVGVALTVTKPIRPKQLERALRLLLRPGDAADAHADTVPEFPRLQGEGVRVLVAEDNLINQKVALGYLGAMGLEADAVNNGREAIEAVLRTPYTLVLMDVHMPEVDGLAATIRIRRGDRGGDVPIVGLTADVRPEARERCKAAGMDGFVAKPVTPHKLAEALGRWIPSMTTGEQDSRVLEAVGGATQGGSTGAVLEISALRRLKELERAGMQGDLVDGLVRMFLERTPARIERMARALSAGQHGFVELEAHSLKSSCRNLGADRMASCAADLEYAASHGMSADDLVSRLSREFTTVATLLRRL
jgi:PAS domain S-box-containing protein